MLGITVQTSKEKKIVQLFQWKLTDSWIARRVTVPFRQKELLAPGLFRLWLNSNVQCACLNNSIFLERQGKISRTVWCYSTHPPTSSQYDWKENGKRNAFERWPFLSHSQISSQFNVFIISKCYVNNNDGKYPRSRFWALDCLTFLYSLENLMSKHYINNNERKYSRRRFWALNCLAFL